MINLPPIAALKAEAKMMKQKWHGEFSLAECMAVVARDHGFDNWSHLMCNHPEVHSNRTKFFDTQKEKRTQAIIERKPH